MRAYSSGYYRPTDWKTGAGLSLTGETLRCLLEGKTTIALYAINSATQGCRQTRRAGKVGVKTVARRAFFVAAAFRPALGFQQHARLKPASTRREPGFSDRVWAPMRLMDRGLVQVRHPRM